MSRKKPNKVFVIRDEMSRPAVHVIARSGKGALTTAKQMVPGGLPRGAIAYEVGEDKAPLAINYKPKGAAA